MAKQDSQAESAAHVFRVLGDATRLKILLSIKNRQSNVSDICKSLKISQPTVSHHLGILRLNSIVNGRRDGKEIFYSINEDPADKAAKAMKGLLNGNSLLKLGPVVMGVTKK